MKHRPGWAETSPSPQRRPRCQDNAAPARRKPPRERLAAQAGGARERRGEPKAVGSTRRASPRPLRPRATAPASRGRSRMEGPAGTGPARSKQRPFLRAPPVHPTRAIRPLAGFGASLQKRAGQALPGDSQRKAHAVPACGAHPARQRLATPEGA